jgi:hypothetical protein
MVEPRAPARHPSRRFGFVKQPGKAKRWHNESNPDFAPGATISDRQMSNLTRETRLGEATTKEQYTRGVKQGRFRYDAVTEGRQFRAQEGRAIRKEIPEVARRLPNL